jgi:hypothetical protein
VTYILIISKIRSFYVHKFNYSVFSSSNLVPWTGKKGKGVCNSEKIFKKKKCEWEGRSEKLTDDHELHSWGVQKNPIQM